MPRGAGGALPATGAGTAVALADKLDTLAGIFAIGQKPSGTKDPFGLRRAAIGALRILVEKKLDLDLRALVTRAVRAAAGAERRRRRRAVGIHDRTPARVLPRCRQRRRSRAASAPKCSTRCAPATPVSPLDFARAARGARASSSRCPRPRASPPPTSASPTSSRRPMPVPAGAVDVAALREPAEKALHEALAGIVVEVERALGKRDYARSARAARDPAPGGRRLLRRRHGQCRGRRTCAATAWRCWRSCATSSRASPTCPACRAETLD